MSGRPPSATRSWHIKDFPSREAQWVAALKWMKEQRGR